MDFTKRLIFWYLENKRDLPWRETKDPYFVWLSEIMLQQTRIAQGLQYFLKFRETYPTVHHLAKADEKEVLKLWQGLGYYSRARNLHATAKYVSTIFEGEFPDTYQELIQLKGIGDYTASAIASICFKQPNAVVDGNVYRVLARYFGIATPINSNTGVKEFKTLAQSMLDKKQPGVYNQAIMDFGSLQCKPQSPNCHACILKDSCHAFEYDRVAVLPKKEKKIKIKHRFFNFLIVVTKERKTCLELREGKGIWQGLYQFPLIELENENTNLLTTDTFLQLIPKNAKVSVLNSEKIIHRLTHQHLHTHFWKIELDQFDQATIDVKDIEQYPMPILLAKFIDQIEL